MAPVSQFESTIWSSLIVTVAAAAYFFSKIFGAELAGETLTVAAIARLGFAVVIVLVAVEVAFQLALNAWCRGEPQTDERDRLIAAKATRNAYYVLVTSLFVLLGHAGIASLVGYIDEMAIGMARVITLTIFVLVVAEVTHYGSRIYYYRRGS